MLQGGFAATADFEYHGSSPAAVVSIAHARRVTDSTQSVGRP